MNRCFRSRVATYRTRSSALGALVRRCVRDAMRSGEFPLASPLSSPTSAARARALFGGFSGTTGLCDCRPSSIIGASPWTSRYGLRSLRAQTTTGSPDSRARCFRACSGLRPRGVHGRLAIATPEVWPSASGHMRRHPGVTALRRRFQFRGSMAGLHVPLSTLHHRPCGRQHMTRGQCGSLHLHCMTLAFTTSRRFSSALSTC